MTARKDWELLKLLILIPEYYHVKLTKFGTQLIQREHV